MGINTAEIAEITEDLYSLQEDLENGIPAIMQTQSFDLATKYIPNSADAMFQDNRDNRKEGQTSLSSVKSWNRDRVSDTHARIVSADSAPHALPLELGTKTDYEISPNGDNLLSWVPEDPSQYPTKEDGDDYIKAGTWYDEEAGRVFSTGVTHPGVDRHNYVYRAQGTWAGNLHKELRRGTADLIIKNGWKPVGP